MSAPTLVEPSLLGCSSRRAKAAEQARLYKGALLPLWLLLASPLPAIAQVTATSEYLQRMDSDGDGRVSPTEYLDWMSYAFDARDLNRDSVLTAEELPGGKGQTVTRLQHRERLAATFKKQDVDKNGYLSAKELAAPPQ